MPLRSHSFMNRLVTILRPSIAVDVTTIRDRIISGYTTIATDHPAYIEPTSSDVVRDGLLGASAFDRAVGYVAEDADIVVNDILKDGSTYWAVDGVVDFSGVRGGWHKRLELVKRNFTQAS